MRAFDLTAEMWSATDRVRQPHLNRMVDLGVPKWAIARLGAHQPPFGVQNVREAGDGLYEPAEEGPLNIVIPIMEHGEVVDLIALQPSNPIRWRWRIGDGWALGGDLLNGDAPIELVRHPLAWMAEAGAAFCLLDWTLSPMRWSMLREGPPLITTDDLLRHRINKAFAASIPPLIGAPIHYDRKGKPHAA